jgi:hypothetical protein
MDYLRFVAREKVHQPAQECESNHLPPADGKKQNGPRVHAHLLSIDNFFIILFFILFLL